MGLKFRIEVDVKPDEAFVYVADLSKHGEWGNPSSALKVEKVTDGAPAAGSAFRSTQRFAGKAMTANLTIRDFEPGQRLSFAAVQGTAAKGQTFVHTFTFTPSGSGTLIERDIDRENASPLAVLGIVFYPAIKADAMKGLRGLKAKLESGSR